MKKILLFLFLILFLYSSAYSKECSDIYKSECPSAQERDKIKENAKNPLCNSTCEKCIVEDDEYCIYNQCYLDKQYRLLKKRLDISENQENCLDNIYLNFKQDLEIQCERYAKEKNKLLELIASDNKCIKEQKNIVKDIKSDIKEKYKDYLSDTNRVLSKSQKKEFGKFKKKQKTKIRKIKKYGAIYKFPCP